MDNNKREYQICTNCVMDTTDKYINFDEDGVCNRCRDYKERILPWWNHGNGHEQELTDIINKIKEDGKGKDYDCILGMSGGLDSSFMLHKIVKDFGLRPFVFHVDAGWNMPNTLDNINKICDKLDIKLHINKLDFEEVRRMQIAFFKTGLSGLDVPQDHAFIAQVDNFAEELGVKYIFNGYNICTEVVSDPASWFEDCGQTADKTYVKDVLKQHENFKTNKYIYTTGFKHKFWLPYVKGIKTIQILNYIPFTKKEMIDTLKKEYGYIPYEEKHFEDVITKFINGWWLPTRFGYDMRKAQLSSLVVTCQMTREEALEKLKRPAVSKEDAKELFKEVADKLKITEEELRGYYELPKVYRKYKNNSWAFEVGIKLYTVLGLDKRIRQ